MDTGKPCDATCMAGTKHAASPRGEERTIGSVDAYVSSPKTDTKSAVILLPDALGSRFPNIQSLADHFASEGFLAIVPDLFGHDDMPLNLPEGFNIPAWLVRHNEEAIDPIVRAVITAVREEFGIDKVGGMGFCIGAKYVVRFLQRGLFDAGFIAHPTLVTSKELQASTSPLSIAAAEMDDHFSATARHEAELILRDRGGEYQITLYGGTLHGFALRADPSVLIQKRQMELAKQQAANWITAFL